MKYVISFETYGVSFKGHYVRETDKVVFYHPINSLGITDPEIERRTSKDSSLYVIEANYPRNMLREVFDQAWSARNPEVAKARQALDEAILLRKSESLAAVKRLCVSFENVEPRT
jgi:hypothetical protein